MEFYNQAARAIDLIDNRRGSLKSIVFNLAGLDRTRSKDGDLQGGRSSTRRTSDGRRLLRLVAQTLRYRKVLESILEAVKISTLERKVFGANSKSLDKPSTHRSNLHHPPRPDSLIIVLVHDHLFSPRGISLAKAHKIRLAIQRHSNSLKAQLSRLMIRRGVSKPDDLLDLHPSQSHHSHHHHTSRATALNQGIPSNMIRWMRINTIMWSVPEAIDWFKEAGWHQVPLHDLTNPTTSSNPSDQPMFAEDDHVSCLLALSSAVALTSLTPYLDGRLIAQDKASCIPAQVLLGELDHISKDWIEVIDATAAPGNKTTMMSSMIGRNGKVWAFERDKQRYEVLKEMINLAGCTNVECIHGDFLAISPADRRFKNVTRIMVDPSCSGSGICNRLDHLTQTDPIEGRDDDRIQSLSRFQTTIVSHALRFPSVCQVSYSTCSIWKEENEEVVLRILNKPEMKELGWTLKDLKAPFINHHKIPWHREGELVSREEKQLTDRMLRFDPTQDATIGFFVAVFLRSSAHVLDPNSDDGRAVSTTALHPRPLPGLMKAKPHPLPSLGRLSSIDRRRKKYRTKHKGCLWKGVRPGKLIFLSPKLV